MSDNFDDIILNDLKPIRIVNSIKKEPSYNLRECLSFYTKQQLIDIAYEHGEYISMSKVKNHILDILEEIIISNIESDSLYFTLSERDMLAKFIENGGVADSNIESSFKLKTLGYIFWFYHNTHFYALCPNEIADRFILSYDSNNENTVKRNNKISDYINALQHIYGVFEVDQLIIVWNKYNKDKLDMLEAYKFLNIVGRRQNYFWWDPPYIVSDYFMHDGEYEEHLGDRSKVEYYIPTKEELNYYLENEFDEENIYYKKIMKLLENSGELNLRAKENISVSIEVACTIDGSLQHIVDEMNDEGFIFDSFEEVNEFAQLFMNLNNTTRKWSIKGHKPVELTRKSGRTINNNKKDNVIPFPQAGGVRSKKIGRNQPCPCGSGKKYKFCCGK